MSNEAIDLSFKPAQPTSLSCLSDEEIDHYNRYGFAQPFDIYTAAEISYLRSYIDGLISSKGDEGHYGINCYQARLAGLWDIATHPRILDHLEDIVGPDVICWASAILCKPPHDPKSIPWHQDASFWKLSPARTVTVWLAIDDVDEGNLAMLFIPGSHNRGKLKERSMGADAAFHKGIALTEDMDAPFVNTLRAGQIFLHADMLVHGSKPNTSDRHRCALTLRYCSPEVRMVDTAWAKGVEAIVCRGIDLTGNWAHHSRPTSDNITTTSSPHVVGNN